ncbi:MAG TPA: hypothetical protein ENK08_03530 [Chloroflexi bacterium]|nr:hypothetical protein [Chloroflexota bacterium]
MERTKGWMVLGALGGGVAVVALLLGLLSASPTVRASPPVEGNPLSFDTAEPLFAPDEDVLGLAVADLDRDGDPDLAFAPGATVRIAAGEGFATSTDVGTCAGTVNRLAVADLDRDGRIDLIAFCDGEVRLWRNPGDPFTMPWTETGAVTASAVLTYPAGTVADLDQDGAPDLVGAGSDGRIYLWRNPMDLGGPFTADWGPPTPMDPADGPVHAVALADMNWDGRPDLLAAVGGEMRVYQNPSAPFSSPWSVSQAWAGAGSDLLSIVTADFDRDGLPDLAAGDAAGRILGWSNPFTPGQPFGGMPPSATILGTLGGPAFALTAADLDHDGKPDLAAAGGGATPSLHVWRNADGLGAPWDGGQVGTWGDALRALATADLDGDGDDDLIAGSESSAAAEVVRWSNAILHRNALFPEKATPIESRPADVQALAAGDLNRDGIPDLVGGDSLGYVLIWESGGSPTTALWTEYVVGRIGEVKAVALGDLDGDGDLEIVTGHDDPPRLLVWRNEGTGLEGPWRDTVVGAPPDPVATIAVADLDRDGHPDLVTGLGEHSLNPHPDPDATVVLWRNDGTPFDTPWPSTNAAVLTYSVNSVAVGDLDGDGWPDIVAGTDHGEPLGDADNPVPRAQWADLFQLLALRNPGTPFAGPWTVAIVGRDPATVTLGPEDNPSHYHGFWGATVNAVALGDLDRDGDLDIVSGDGVEADYQLKVWENDGTPFDGQPASFHWTWQPTAVWYGTPPSPPWMGGAVVALTVADFNRDGWPDIAPGITRWLRMWFENTGTPFGSSITDTHWIAHTIVPNQEIVRAVVAADFDRDGDADLATGSERWDGPELTYWHNDGGHICEIAASTDAPPIQHLETDDVLAIRVSHEGQDSEEQARLVRWRLRFTGPDGTPLTSEQANDLIDTLWIYRDGGNQRWTTGDTPVLTTTTMSLDSEGYQTLTFALGDPLMVLSPGETVYYFVVVRIADGAMSATPNEFQVWFDADADSLAEGVDSGASLFIGDTDPVGSGIVAAVGPPASIGVESRGDGKGTEVETWEIASGYFYDFHAVARDALGHFVQAEPATWTLVPVSGGVVPGDLSVGPDGTWARFSGHLTGTARLVITHTTLGTDTTGLIRVTPPPTQMVLEADPPEMVADGTSSITLRAYLWDGPGDPVADHVPVTFTVVGGEASAHLPADPFVTTTLGGVASAPLLADIRTGQVRVRAETGRVTDVVTVTLRPGPLDRFRVKGYSTVVYAGEHLFTGPEVTALDLYGNVKTDYTGAVYFLSSDPQATLSYTLGSPYTFTPADGGVHWFTGTAFVLRTAGMQTITVTDGTVAEPFGPIEVRHAFAVGRIELHMAPAVITAGERTTAVVEGFDLYGNPMGELDPIMCKYTIDAEAGGEWVGNVYTTERFGTWTVVATTRTDPPHSDSATLWVLPTARIFLPLVLAER